MSRRNNRLLANIIRDSLLVNKESSHDKDVKRGANGLVREVTQTLALVGFMVQLGFTRWAGAFLPQSCSVRLDYF